MTERTRDHVGGSSEPTPAGTRRALVGGIEAGGSKFVCGIGTGPDDVRAAVTIPTTTPRETLAAALTFFRTHASDARLTALGIAAFGPLDLDPRSPTHGSITRTPKPGWSGVDLLAPFRTALGVPVDIDTDVNGAALAEQRWGAARGLRTFVYLTVGTGIGGGGLVNGAPLHGLVHPEMGHMRVPRDPADRFAGICPFHGDCLEGLASGPALEARWGRPPVELSAEHPAWELESRYIALAVANVVMVLSPERFVIGGGVMRQPALLPAVRAEIARLLGGYVQARAVENLDDFVTPPSLGELTGLLGGFALAEAVSSGVIEGR